MNGTDTFLDINNAHLRVNNGNVQASTFVLDQIDFIASSNASTTVGFNNATTAFLAASNIEVGTANLFVDTTTSNVGIGTNAPQDTLHINGGTRIAGHILPTVNDTYDLGSAEYKIRHLFLGNSSLWLGDESRITFTGGKMKFRRRKKNALPRGLATIAANQGHTSEQQTTSAALAYAGVSTVEEMKLEHWIDYTKTLDETKEINDIFTEDANDYEATTASEAFKEIGDDIFSQHNVSIGKTTAPTSALDVVGTVKATAFEGDGSALTGITSGQWTESSGDIYRSSGNVGVGTDSPAKTLHVAGTMRIANATTNTETTDIVKIAAVNTTTTTTTPNTSWSQEQKLLAYQYSSYDYFGQQSAVSGDGNTICVGARNEDTTAGDSGAVYVYTGGPSWTYRARLKASDAQASDLLGEAGLAISDDGRTIVVAARKEDTGGAEAGAAYVFMSSNSTWGSFTQQKLQASNKAADDQFCRCDVSGDGNTIIVGAPHEDGPTNSVASSGAAYIYSRSGNSWSEDQILYPSDPVVSNYFGVDNALNEDGTVAAIAATGDDTTATDSGAVYIFTKSNGTWSQEIKLKVTSGGPNASDNWGGVSLSDDGLTLSVGTSGDDTTASNSGAVYVFNKSSGTWSQTIKLKANNAGANDKLGGRTRISGNGNTIVSGAREEDTGSGNAGSAYIFTLNNGTWSQRQQIQASDRASSDYFGDSVGISKDGTVICVGAVLEDGGGGDSGAAYAFRGSGGGTTTTTTTIDSKLKVNDTIVASAFEGDGSALTGITSGQWTESGGDIYRSSGNVGIGTTSPNTTLHVKNETDSSGTGDAYISDKTKKPTECLRLQGKYHNTGSGALLRFTNQHNSGTFPNTGEYNLAGIAGYDHDNSWGGGLVFYTSPGSGTGGDNLTHRMSIDQSGNVGIGTIAPAQQLEVHGNIRAGGNSHENGYVQMSNNGSVFRNYNGNGAGLHFTGGAVIPADANGGNHTTSYTKLGHSSYRWGQIYSTSSSISTSDRNEKQDINEITESERKVASKIVDLFRTFRMKDAVSKKGDEARLHNGVIAQDLIEVFQSEGLNAHRYGLFCYDDIWLVDGENELYETVYEKDDSEDDGVKEVKVKTGVFADKDTPGAVATPGPYSIRYEELLCFVVAGELQNERIKYSTLEARVAALENV